MTKRKSLESDLEVKFYKTWNATFPDYKPATQYKFHPTRRFRLDFAWPSKKVAVEIHGMGPGHCSLQGMTQDHDKHYEAIRLNWTVLYFTSSHLTPKNIDETCRKVADVLGIKIEAPTRYVSKRERVERWTKRSS